MRNPTVTAGSQTTIILNQRLSDFLKTFSAVLPCKSLLYKYYFSNFNQK